MVEGDFYAEIVEATGCDLLLDVGNLYANAVNGGLSPLELLHSFPLERVAMVHMAGGTAVDGFYEDTHAHPVPEPVFTLLGELFARVGPRPVLLERDSGFGAFAALSAEAVRLRQMTAAAGRGRDDAPRPARPRVVEDRAPSLGARQARVAEMLVAATPPPEEETVPFGVGAIARTRTMLLQKRIDEALPLLPMLGARGDGVRDHALGALRDRPRAPRAAAIADAWWVAIAALGDPGAAPEARLDLLALRARFRGPDADGGFAPRRAPFIGFEALPDGTRVWAFKGPGRAAVRQTSPGSFPARRVALSHWRPR
jgi:hypothetical protein